MHHKRLYGGGSGHAEGSQHGSAPAHHDATSHPAHRAGQHGGSHTEPVVRLGSGFGQDQPTTPDLIGQAPPSDVQTILQAPAPAGTGATAPEPTTSGQPAPDGTAASPPTAAASTGGNSDVLPSVAPSKEKVQDAEALLSSKLVGAKGLVLSNVLNSYIEYDAYLNRRMANVKDKIAKQEATKELVVEVALTIPFFFAGPLVDAAAAKIATKIGPVLGKDLGEDGIAAVEKNIEGASKKVGEEMLKASKKELAKSFRIGTDRQNGRLLYIKSAIGAIDASRKALVKEINGASDVAALALVLATVLTQDEATFGQGFEKLLSDWSQNELPRLIQEATPQLDLTQMGP